MHVYYIYKRTITPAAIYSRQTMREVLLTSSGNLVRKHLIIQLKRLYLFQASLPFMTLNHKIQLFIFDKCVD